MSQKSCFIKSCKNTSLNSPNKIFITVPKNVNIRTLWYQAINNSDPIPSGAAIFCCEDHFNLESDAENWQYYKTIGQRIRLKPGTVPHRNLADTSSTRPQLSPLTRKRKGDILETLSVRRRLYDDPQPSTSHEGNTDTVPSSSGEFVHRHCVHKDMPSSLSVSITTANKSVMVKPETKFKFTSTKVYTAEKGVNTIKRKTTEKQQAQELKDDSTDNASASDVASHISNVSESSDNKYVKSENTELCKLENHSRFYLGLPKDCYFIINLIVEESYLCHTDVMVALKKIRTNDQFSRIGLDFDKSTSQISKIFNKSVPVIAFLMQQLIIWPSNWKIKKLLPNQFKAYYHNVQAIIDCFEIEVEKPSNALHQALTWSEYKKCNTIKYLVGCTPNGLINFISCGFGGRATDVEIVKNSSFIDVLPMNCVIMADRGFKQIETIINTKNSRLLRPPSLSSGQKLSKHEVRYGKVISALRVHIERLIRRLREFAMLKPHAVIRSRIVHLLDHVVIIACGLVNLQDRLIKY